MLLSLSLAKVSWFKHDENERQREIGVYTVAEAGYFLGHDHRLVVRIRQGCGHSHY